VRCDGKKMKKSDGFSLVELLIALAILGVVIASAYGVFDSQQKVYAVQDQVMGMEQNLRACIELISSEARYAGLNVKLAENGRLDSSFAAKIPEAFKPTSPVAVTLSSADFPLKITQGDSQSPDTITIVAAICDETNPSVVANSGGVSAGSTLVKVKTSDHKIRAGDIIYIGRPGIYEYAGVTETSGIKLTIDTDPDSSGNQGLQHDYPEGTEIGEISVVSYAVYTNTSPWVLKRKVNKGNFQPVGENIVDLQATQDGKKTVITLDARTEKSDPNYSENGGYRRACCSVVVVPQNM
jgi:prepilin-type N-terminal cleavage/methylation domain-containing protein